MCQHLANANNFGHIRRVNNLLGLYVPVLAIPLELRARHETGTALRGEPRPTPGMNARAISSAV